MNAEAKRPESVAGAVGAGAVILVTLLTGLAVLGLGVKSLDPEATLARWFRPAELPFGLVPVEAARQSDGEVLLRLSNPDAPPEAERVELPEVEPESKSLAPEPIDWSAIAVGAAGTPPTEALFVTWPLAAARGQLASLFESRDPDPQGGLREQSRGVDPLAGLGAQGGRRVLAGGRLPWGAFEAPYVLERKFEPGGTFVDTLRVNLSREREALVVFLRWPRGLPASTERAEEFLAALEPVELVESAAD